MQLGSQQRPARRGGLRCRQVPTHSRWRLHRPGARTSRQSRYELSECLRLTIESAGQGVTAVRLSTNKRLAELGESICSLAEAIQDAHHRRVERYERGCRY